MSDDCFNIFENQTRLYDAYRSHSVILSASKIKLNLTLCLMNHHTSKDVFLCVIKYKTFKMYAEFEVNLHSFLTLTEMSD